MSNAQYAQQMITEAGVYRAWPLSWTVEPPKDPSKSSSTAIAIQFAIHERWDATEGGGGVWTPMPIGWFVYGRSWIVKRDGTLNDAAIKNLATAKLWSGDFGAFEGEPPNVFVLLDVQAEEYNGKVTCKANWIHPDADTPPERPSGFRPADPDLLSALRAKFGGAVRAVVGGGAPVGRPPSPQAAAAPVTPAAPAPAPSTPPARSATPPARASAPQAPLAPPAPAGGGDVVAGITPPF